ncbi:hypothetical protein PT276_06880 [Orbaceae bacterium ESL0721]|nr:hypothetical protein [Orbaceae bacterium ESL0721]
MRRSTTNMVLAQLVLMSLGVMPVNGFCTIGGYLNYHGDYSSGQITAIRPYVYGSANDSLLDQIKHSDLVVMFGHNIAETRMSGGGQVTETLPCVRGEQCAGDYYRSPPL